MPASNTSASMLSQQRNTDVSFARRPHAPSTLLLFSDSACFEIGQTETQTESFMTDPAIVGSQNNFDQPPACAGVLGLKEKSLL